MSVGVGGGDGGGDGGGGGIHPSPGKEAFPFALLGQWYASSIHHGVTSVWKSIFGGNGGGGGGAKRFAKSDHHTHSPT